MVDNPFDNNNTNFVLSYELLSLLQWLTEHESDTLKHLVHRAVQSHLSKHTTGMIHTDEQEDVIKQSIIDFFELLDAYLHEALHEQSVHTTLQRNAMPAINHIDATACDSETIQDSIEHASNKLSGHYSREAAQEVLFKELLKRWKPHKKQAMN